MRSQRDSNASSVFNTGIGMKKSGGLVNLLFGRRRKSRIRASNRAVVAPTLGSTQGDRSVDRPADRLSDRASDRRADRRARKAEPVLPKTPRRSLSFGKSRPDPSQPKRGFLGFLPFGKKTRKTSSVPTSSVRSAKRNLKHNPTAQNTVQSGSSDRVVNFPKKPARPTLEDLRARRQDRAPRHHALFTPPINPIHFPRPRNRPETFFLYALRLLILGVGLGVISGTVLSVWDPTARLTAGANSAVDPKLEKVAEEVPLRLTQELIPLKTQIKALMAKNAALSPTVMLVDLDSHSYVDIGGSDVVAAASTIKLPILIAFFQDVDQGKIQLDQPIAMRKDLIATEAGEMQYQPVGSKFSAIKTVTEMITSSDNTATNMIIDLLGGMEVLNQRFKSWGLTGTMLRNPLPDVAGTNTTSARDMAQILSQLSDVKLVSGKSRDRIFDLMRRVQYNTLLPKGLGEGATIAHKTGTIGTMLADVGLIDTATGQRYVAAVLVKRPKDEDKANELIQQISRLGYQAFNQQAAAPSVKDQPKERGESGRSRIAQP